MNVHSYNIGCESMSCTRRSRSAAAVFSVRDSKPLDSKQNDQKCTQRFFCICASHRWIASGSLLLLVVFNMRNFVGGRILRHAFFMLCARAFPPVADDHRLAYTFERGRALAAARRPSRVRHVSRRSLLLCARSSSCCARIFAALAGGVVDGEATDSERDGECARARIAKTRCGDCNRRASSEFARASFLIEALRVACSRRRARARARVDDREKCFRRRF